MAVLPKMCVPFSQSRLFCVPSFYNEGIPRCLMEAAAMELPVITSMNRGCKEVVLNNSTGYICNRHDPFDLADKMEKMINLSPKNAHAWGKTADPSLSGNSVLMSSSMNTQIPSSMICPIKFSPFSGIPTPPRPVSAVPRSKPHIRMGIVELANPFPVHSSQVG